jgi:hypothetical protein
MAFVRHVTLVANTVSTVTVTDNSASFEVINRNGVAEVFISHNGTASPPDPTVAGNDFPVIAGAIGASGTFRRSSSAAIVVKLISTGATAVAVRGI